MAEDFFQGKGVLIMEGIFEMNFNLQMDNFYAKRTVLSVLGTIVSLDAMDTLNTMDAMLLSKQQHQQHQ